ncbi:MAG: ester cyclase [Chloroflexi bacterium]|nr:ester cyclase [Chloroflexota bacterium]OJV90249.1 MAG: hypothetical protein BGO39_01490 [Chloroflexi bacterium 54-19]
MLALKGTSPSRRQPLAGFDPDYVDIIDYIVRCTHKIWEERNVGLLYSHYASNVVVHTPDSEIVGRDKIITETIKMQAAFPDLRIYAEDVIWSGDDKTGFHTSHRATWVARNTGYSRYGAPTGRRVVYREIAHCIVKENRITEEWTSRDELAMVWQMGLDAFDLARRVAAREVEDGFRPPILLGTGEVERLLGQTTPEQVPPPPQEGFDVEYFVRRAIHEIWNWRMFGKIRDYYLPNFQSYNSSNRILYGWGDLEVFVTQMLAAFPDGRMLPDQVLVNSDEPGVYRVAVRWYFQGTHQGPGLYGEPTGKPVQIMGTTHYEIQNEKFVREWYVFDEFSLLKQIYGPA